MSVPRVVTGLLHIGALGTMMALPYHDIPSWLCGFLGGATCILYIAMCSR